jgi:L-asparaginase
LKNDPDQTQSLTPSPDRFHAGTLRSRLDRGVTGCPELLTSPTMRKRVYIAYTGGTIGMTKHGNAYAPTPGFLEAQLREMPELRDPQMPEFVVHEYDPLLDSSEMRPEHWRRIAEDIAAQHDLYDAFVVLHGTDTMAYTASALAFLLEIDKTVILTGSQVPLCEVRNDARENLITSLLIAAQHQVPEVCLYFAGRLLRGCRAVKVDAEDFMAFASPNFPALGVAGTRIEINQVLIRDRKKHTQIHAQKHSSRHVLPLTRQPVIAAMRLFPGISAQILENMLKPPLEGLVLEAYGAGNGPTSTPGFLDALRHAHDRGVVVVACTQCLRGSVDLAAYASSLASAGVVGGRDMTIEAALAKLYALLGQGLPPERVRALMSEDWRGELSLDG